MNFYIKPSLLTIIFTVFNYGTVISQDNHKFTIILDAGHGGKDPGNSYHGFIEKDIALKTTLKVGDYLEKEKDFKVIFTRKTDVFIELANRPKVANKANANLFVSIHCNSVKNFIPSGTETFVMGLLRSNMNLEVAKNENSVILLEDNYKERYQGFDPKKPESLLGLTILQEENLNNSISLANKIQNNFSNKLSRKTRGVKQQPLWVLDAAYMPSVLIELGFLSNKEEGEFLNSEAGQDKMAKQIAEAIIEYKKDFFGEDNKSLDIKVNDTKENTIENKLKEEKNEIVSKKIETKSNITYKVQIAAGIKKIDLKANNFKGLKKISSTFENKLFKYFFGETSDIDEAKKMQIEARKKGFTSAFIVVIKDGKYISL